MTATDADAGGRQPGFIIICPRTHGSPAGEKNFFGQVGMYLSLDHPLPLILFGYAALLIFGIKFIYEPTNPNLHPVDEKYHDL